MVGDVFTDAGGSSPPFAALFGLNMLLTAPAGCVHADADVARWMQEAGFASTDVVAFPPPMPHRVVLECERVIRKIGALLSGTLIGRDTGEILMKICCFR